MIAVWLVGPPSVVASATTSAGSRPAVSAGARSSASRTDGTAGSGTPGSGSPLSSAMTRSRMSRRSVTRSAISPPSWVKRSTNWSTAATTARTAGVPLLICFSAAPNHARSCASVAVAASTSDAAPVACAARSRSRSATALGGSGESGRLRRALRLVDVGRRLRPRRVPEGGRGGSPGRTECRRQPGRPAKRCPQVGRRTRDPRAVTWAAMRRSCEADYKPTIDKSTRSGVKQHIPT